MAQISIPLQPKNSDGPLQTLIIGRISTEYQNEENIEASYRFVEDYLKQIHAGPLNIKHLGGRGSGMLTDRASIRAAEELIATGTVDLVIAEDLSRIYRNPRHQYDFVQNAVDQETRVICLGDNLDTADEHWEVMMGAAALRHGLFIPDTRRRVRRTATHAFHQGGMVTKVKFGYRKLTKNEADSGRFGPKGLMIAKVPAATPTIRSMRDRYLRGASYASIAQWLEDEQVSPGPYVENRRWSGGRVKDLLTDSILSGRRTFRKSICKPIYKTGKHKQQKNANPETEYYPELSHLSVEQHEELLLEVTRRSQATLKVRSPRGGPKYKRRNIPRSRSIWPGQAASCAICGGRMYYMGKHLKCENARHGGPQTCWNHVQVSAELTRERVLGWLFAYLNQDPSFRPTLLDATCAELKQIADRQAQNDGDACRRISSLKKQADNLARAIAAGGELDALLTQLRHVNGELETAKQQVADAAPPAAGQAFASNAWIESRLDKALNTLPATSYDFAELMRRIIPEFLIQPVQTLDNSYVRPRARLTLCLQGLHQVPTETPEQTEGVRVVLDLFEPPLHIRHLERCLTARDAHPRMSHRKIASLLELNYMTVKRAFDYARLMASIGASEPYRELHTRPEQASRWHGRPLLKS